MAIYKEFERLKSISTDRKTGEKLQVSDLCKKLTIFIHIAFSLLKN